MVRRVVLPILILAGLAGPVLAGQASGSFSAGIVIGSGQPTASAASSTYTWGAAAISVERAGFGNPQRVAKSDTLYWFEAERDGALFRVGVSISSGQIVEVNPA